MNKQKLLLHKQKLLLRNFQSPGDILMLTSAVRDIYLSHGNDYEIKVETSCPDLWENNPYISDFNYTTLKNGEIIADDGSLVMAMECNYDIIHSSNTGAYHFVHGFRKFIEKRLQIIIPSTFMKGDIHLSNDEKKWSSQIQDLGIEDDFWIMCAGGKYDYTAKWWDPERYQKVVDYFKGKITFVQVGHKDHWHPPLEGVIDLIGKTDMRQFIRLVYHSVGVVCPITFAMHAAAAVPVKENRPKNRAAVVIAGGREPAQWEAYPHHRFLSTNGALMCCDNGGCWKSRCQPVGDGDDKDKEENRCPLPIAVGNDLNIPKCMDMISAEDVIRNIEMYYDGGALQYNESKN